MKRMTLALGLLGGVALGGAAAAQTPPAPQAAPKPPASSSPAAPNPNPSAAPQAAPGGQQNAQNAAPAVPMPSGPPEGMIVETPNGFYLVRPGDPNPRRLDLGQAAPGQAAPNAGPAPSEPQPGDEAMDDQGDDAMPPPPHGHRGPMPPRPAEGKGARFRIRTPNVTLGMKCPDDETIKACVDAISQLLDKVEAPAH